MAKAARKTRKEVLRDFRREQILEGAWEVIGRVGYGDASVDRIAEAAGVARSTVYVYFDGKDGILDGCFARGRAELGERMAAAVAGARNAEARLAAFITAMLGYVDENREFFRAVIGLQGLDPFFSEAVGSSELAGLREESRAALGRILAEGVEVGELPRQDLERAQHWLGALLYGALMRRSHSVAPAPAAEDGPALAHLFLYGIAGH